MPAEPTARTGAQRNSYDEFAREAGAIKNVLIFAMESNLQRRFITQGANKIFTTLTNEFSQAPRIVKYDAVVRFFEAKLHKGQAVSPHVLNMNDNVTSRYRSRRDGYTVQMTNEQHFRVNIFLQVLCYLFSN